VGIEKSEEAQKLGELGCDIGQGYLFAKAMTEQELMDMVMAARTETKGAVQPAKGAVPPAGVTVPPNKDAGAAKRPS
jgi:predicted signal transduction protein with EAL and GGDEF domain